MLGANDIGTLAVAIGQIAAVSTGDGPVTIAGQSQSNIGDVTADIGGSATTDAVTGTVSKAVTALGKVWSRKNVTIGQADVGKQVTDGFAKVVVIGLVYRIMLMVILFGSLLVPPGIFFALPVVVIGAFVALTVIGLARDLSALIGLLMLRAASWSPTRLCCLISCSTRSRRARRCAQR